MAKLVSYILQIINIPAFTQSWVSAGILDKRVINLKLKLSFLFIFFSIFIYGGADRGGYIRYNYNTVTGKYDFKIYTWTNYNAAFADYCDLTLYIDGGVDSIICQRINGTNPCPNGGSG